MNETITELRDEKGFTLIHHAVLKGRHEKIKPLIDFAMKKQRISDDDIKLWINSKSVKDKFTPLHFASFKNNLSAIKILIENGADVFEKNQYGLNMLHVAAQGDAAASLFLFKSLGLDINKQDHRGSTPLHWSCYS